MSRFFEIITALGSLATCGAFIMLFIKDKGKQKQISKLTDIASSLENQSEYLNKQNDLLAQQVDIFRNTSILKGQDGGALEMLRKIEEKKLLLSVKPNIWTNGGMEKGFPRQLHIDISNKGEYAKLWAYALTSDDIEFFDEQLPWELEKGQSMFLYARPKVNKQVKDCKYEIELRYSDSLENKYSTIFAGQGGRVRVIATKEL